jgi:ribonuclease G
MNKELYVSSTPHETKVALMEDDQLAEVFFERENEYTLAGSIYKGRVTRVLPGMQSAFVDIGLERDAFLYVSDFLELSGDEEDEEFGEIPAPRGAIDVGKQQEAQSAETQTGIAEPATEDDSDLEAIFEEEAPSPTSSDEEGETAASDDENGEGARRWRGRRRRRGGRRGRGSDRDIRTESAAEPETVAQEQPREESRREEPRREEPRREESRREEWRREEPRQRQSYGPPAGYEPILLPGESISKYRNMGASKSEEPASAPAESYDGAADMPVENFTASADVDQETQEEATHLDQGFEVVEREREELASSTVEEQHTQAPSEESHVAAVEHSHAEAPAAEVVTQEEQRPRGRRRWGWRRFKDNPEQQPAAAVEAPAAPETATEVHTSHEPEQEHVAEQPAEASTAHAAVEQHDTAASSHHSDSEPLFEREHLTANTGYHEGTRANARTPEDHAAAQAQYHVHVEQHAAPSEAPEGRTLEHEVLDEEEAEMQAMPEDVSAMREVAGDEELVLEEETLDADNDYSERWVPKIEDVDEDEIVAAEERGEHVFEGDDDEAEEAEDEAIERAEVRAAAPTAGYQQRAERPAYDRERRGRFDRNRRGGPGGRRNFRSRPNSHRHQPLITDLLKEGQEVLIQIAKEPIGKKGARITSHIALPGRFLVYMPTVNHVGVSRKINSDEERQRLKRIVTSERENGLGGFIVRTAAANIKEEDLRADIRFLKHLWHEIKSRADSSKSPALIYHDLNLVERVLRDQVNADFSQIWVDTEDEYERVVRFANRFQPSLVRRIKLYTKEAPLFEQFGIQDEINRSLKSKVWLKSGGHIVINQTEALVAIDVNTGKFVGKTQRLEDTIVKVNVDAIKEIVRQIRLRDLGGIIVIDFIDMDERKNRQKVMIALEEALRWDRAPSKVLQFNDFGLVAITRKRVKQSLERTLAEPCPYCTGAGFVKSVPTVCNELYIEMRKMTKVHDKEDITVRVNPEVAKALKASNGKLLTELEDLTGKTVLVKSDPALHQENFDIH